MAELEHSDPDSDGPEWRLLVAPLAGTFRALPDHDAQAAPGAAVVSSGAQLGHVEMRGGRHLVAPPLPGDDASNGWSRTATRSARAAAGPAAARSASSPARAGLGTVPRLRPSSPQQATAQKPQPTRPQATAATERQQLHATHRRHRGCADPGVRRLPACAGGHQRRARRRWTPRRVDPQPGRHRQPPDRRPGRDGRRHGRGRRRQGAGRQRPVPRRHRPGDRRHLHAEAPIPNTAARSRRGSASSPRARST